MAVKWRDSFVNPVVTLGRSSVNIRGIEVGDIFYYVKIYMAV